MHFVQWYLRWNKWFHVIRQKKLFIEEKALTYSYCFLGRTGSSKNRNRSTYTCWREFLKIFKFFVHWEYIHAARSFFVRLKLFLIFLTVGKVYHKTFLSKEQFHVKNGETRLTLRTSFFCCSLKATWMSNKTKLSLFSFDFMAKLSTTSSKLFQYKFQLVDIYIAKVNHSLSCGYQTNYVTTPLLYFVCYWLFSAVILKTTIVVAVIDFVYFR